MRFDVYLFEKGYVKSRQKAKSLIEDGNVFVDSKVINKPSYMIDECVEHKVEILDDCPYVSRGGLKLEKILDVTGISVADKVCIDIGASTGGFTHCLLLNGAKKIFAVDSGRDQLAKIIKEDSRVISIENCNARYISKEQIGEAVDVITIDVSFISQALIIPSATKLLKPDGVYLSLIKPQFEVGKANVGKGGIVKDKKHHLSAALSVIASAVENGLICTCFTKSPIQGGDGNVEYLAAFSFNGEQVKEENIKKIIFE